MHGSFQKNKMTESVCFTFYYCFHILKKEKKKEKKEKKKIIYKYFIFMDG